MKRVIICKPDFMKIDHWKADAFINEKLYKEGYRPHMVLTETNDFKNNQWIFEWEEEKMKIYLASGWFNEEQERRVKKAEQILRDAGHEVFSPREHQNEDIEFGTKEWRKATFQNDVDHVDWCDIIVAIYNEEDSGTMWELGYAYAKGKPSVVVNENYGEIVNLMISDSLTTYVETWEGLMLVTKDLEYTWNLPEVEYNGAVI